MPASPQRKGQGFCPLGAVKAATVGALVWGAPLCCRGQQALPEAPSWVLQLHGLPASTEFRGASSAPTEQAALLAPAPSRFAEFPRIVSHTYTADGSSLYPALIASGSIGLSSRTAGGGAEQDDHALPPCVSRKPAGSAPAGAAVAAQSSISQPCLEENPLQPIVVNKRVPPLTREQKGYLAIRDVIDPFNLITVIGYAGIDTASNSHTAYGPGFAGFGRLTGYSLVEDMQGEFVGTFVIPSLAHQDPRYFRVPDRPFVRRLLHAVQHTVISQHDDGTPMPNYATLLTYPISAELTNLYVPGVQTDGPSTAKRIGLGLATDPVGQIVAEFLPDVAKRIHIRIIFVQEILQQVAQGGTGGAVATAP